MYIRGGWESARIHFHEILSFFDTGINKDKNKISIISLNNIINNDPFNIISKEHNNKITCGCIHHSITSPFFILSSNSVIQGPCVR